MLTKSGIELTIGADPEFFLIDGSKNVSAHGFLHDFGGKHNPTKVNKGAIQVDGTALEFNIDPASTPEEFINNIDAVLAVLRERVPTNYGFKFSPVHYYTSDYFQEIPEEAKELGCDPDFNAYSLQANPKPNVDLPFRTGSGHIHVGWTTGMDVTSKVVLGQVATLVRQLDAILFPASLIWDSRGSSRRAMYGAPGAFRVKPYGVEYRVLSNSWLEKKELQKWIFKSVVRAFDLLTDGVILPEKAWRDAVGDGIYPAKDVYSYLRNLYNTHGFEDLPSEAYYA